MFGAPSVEDLHWFPRVYRWLRDLRSPWSELLLVGAAAGAYLAPVTGGAIVGTYEGSLPSLLLGFPLVFGGMALAYQLVPRDPLPKP